MEKEEELVTMDSGEIPYHPLFRILLVANALYSYDKVNVLPASARRVLEQIGLLELLKDKSSLSKKDLLPLFRDSEPRLYRFVFPLVRIGLLRKERLNGVGTVFRLDKSVELNMKEELFKVQAWISSDKNKDASEITRNTGEVVGSPLDYVETPLGIVKLKPKTQTVK